MSHMEPATHYANAEANADTRDAARHDLVQRGILTTMDDHRRYDGQLLAALAMQVDPATWQSALDRAARIMMRLDAERDAQ